MFSSTLRKRPIWRHIGPALASSSIAHFQESPMTSRDLVVPVQVHERQIAVHALLLTAEDVSTGEAANRLQSRSSAVRSRNAIELVILVTGVSGAHGGFTSVISLQNLLLEHGLPPSLYVHSAERIMPTLEKFIGKLREPNLEAPAKAPLPRQLLAHATATAPNRLLSEHQVSTLNQLFPSIRALERGTSTADGQAQIRSYLDGRTARDVIDFWQDEWIV